MGFNAWLRHTTGLSLYDFRVLDEDNTSAKWVQKLFDGWKKTATSTEITRAIEDAADAGFTVNA